MPAKWTKMTIKIRTDHHAMINTLAKMKRKRPYEILEEIIDFYIKHNDNIKKYISM